MAKLSDFDWDEAGHITTKKFISYKLPNSYQTFAVSADEKTVATKNKSSVIGIVAYACTKDIDLDGYMNKLLSETELSTNQKDNFIYMKEKLEECTNVSA